MKNKKRVALVLLPIMVILFIVGCGKKTVETTYESEVNGVKITMTFYSKGDKVTKQTTESIVPYTVYGVTDKEAVKEIVDTQLEGSKGIKGYSEEVEYKDDHLVQKLLIDYDKVDMSELAGKSIFAGDTPGKGKVISLKETIKMIEGQGFKKVK